MDLTGIKRHILRRYAQGTLSIDDIEALADKAAGASMAGAPTVDITSLGTDGANSSGVLTVNTAALLSIVEDILDTIDPIDIATVPRRAFVRADFSHTLYTNTL